MSYPVLGQVLFVLLQLTRIHFDVCVSAFMCVSPKLKAATANCMMRDQLPGCAI